MTNGGVRSAMPAIGNVLGAKYRIERLLGEGGMATVFEAHHQRLGQRVALKLLAPDFATDPELVARFEREARALAQLRTRHVARVMDVDATPTGLPYIVMEFLEGRDLENELAARGRLPVDEAVDYVLQTCAAMAEAHGMGIVHRDLKPANLFLADDEAGRVVKVLDFGISKVVGESTRLTGAGAVMGTVLYMSPEQVRASGDVDIRADIWSLGVILFELVTGRAPWEGSSQRIAASIVSQDAPDVRAFAAVPEPVATAIRTMLQRDRAMRFSSVRELAAVLAPFARPESIGAAVAAQILNGHSSSRMRGSLPSFAYVPPPLVAPPPSEPHLYAGPLETTGGRTRAFVAIGVVLGVLAAVGLVLTIAALRARAAHGTSAVPTLTAEPSAAPAASAEAASEHPAAPEAIPAPPPTSTETQGAPSARAPSSPVPAPPRESARAPAPAASEPPPFL